MNAIDKLRCTSAACARLFTQAGRPVALQLVVPGPVVAYQRVMQGKAAGVIPKESRAWRDRVVPVVRLAWRGLPAIDAPCRLDTYAIAQRPKYAKADPEAFLWRPVKPDRDNVAKLVQDAIQDAGVLVDDGRVVCGEPYSLWAPAGQPPRIIAWLVVRVPALPAMPGMRAPAAPLEVGPWDDVRAVGVVPAGL